jgi:HSP20 family protein
MANITRWDPFGDMLSLRQAMDRLFEDAFVRPRQLMHIGGEEAMATLAVDMHETDSDIVLSAAVPGVKPEDLDISIQGDVLTIKGESRSDDEVKEESYLRRERRFGSFFRQVQLPKPVRSDGADATFENGVLKLRLPKSEEARERKIPVKAAASDGTQPVIEGQPE